MFPGRGPILQWGIKKGEAQSLSVQAECTTSTTRGARYWESIRMSERLSVKKRHRAHPAWLALPLGVGTLLTLTVGLVARQTVREPYATPFFHLFFTDTLTMKVWLATTVVVLACGQ